MKDCFNTNVRYFIPCWASEKWKNPRLVSNTEDKRRDRAE